MIGVEHASEHHAIDRAAVNNCFLNAIVQALWNLRSFRETFLHGQHCAHTRGCSADAADMLSNASAHSNPTPAQESDVATWEQSSAIQSGRSSRSSKSAQESNGSATTASTTALEMSTEGASTRSVRDPSDCCVCALRAMFADCNAGSALPLANLLREALRAAYASQNRFALGEMEDAADAFEALCEIFHAASVTHSHSSSVKHADVVTEASKFTPDIASAPIECDSCVAHSVFGIHSVDQATCRSCGAVEEPTNAISFVYPLTISDLLEEPTVEARRNFRRPSLTHLLSHYRLSHSCSCSQRMEANRWITHMPKVLVLSLCWPQPEPPREQVRRVMALLEPVLASSSIRGQDADDDMYVLRGTICFQVNHYVALFWIWSRNAWMLFDDSVREVGTLSDFVDMVVNGDLVPTLVFYEKLENAMQREDIEAYASYTQAKGKRSWRSRSTRCSIQ